MFRLSQHHIQGARDGKFKNQLLEDIPFIYGSTIGMQRW
jgi:hypothetical protein